MRCSGRQNVTTPHNPSSHIDQSTLDIHLQFIECGNMLKSIFFVLNLNDLSEFIT